MSGRNAAVDLRSTLFVALCCLGIGVDAYSIPFSFSNSAELVNKVCLYPCLALGLEKGTQVTVDFSITNSNSGAQGECAELPPYHLSHSDAIRVLETSFFCSLYSESIHRPPY